MPRFRSAVGLLLIATSLAAQGGEDFDVGLGLQERGLHAEAARQYERFLAGHADAAEATEAWYRLGVCREECGKDAEARQAYAKMLAGDAEFRHRAEGRYRLGRLWQEAGKPSEAAAQFEALGKEAGAKHYLAPAASFALAECLEAQQKKSEALAAYDRAAGLAPKGDLAFPALYKAGFLALGADEPLAAAERFGKAADGFPSHEAASECRYLQGLALARSGRGREAEKAYVRVTEGPWADDALIGRADCLEQRGDAVGALRVLDELRRRFPASPLRARALERAGFARLADGKAEEAGRLFIEACEALGDGGDAEARARCAYGLAEARVAQAQDADAVTAYAEVGRLSKDPALRGDAAYGALFVLHRLGRHEESLRLAHSFVGEHPGHRLELQARFAVAENLWALERWAEAAQAYGETQGAAIAAGQAAAADPGTGDAARRAAIALARRCAYKVAWCDWLRGEAATAATGFGSLAEDRELDEGLREESLAMQVLALWKAGKADEALERADLYLARHPKGQRLAQTERVAAQVLRGQDKGEAAEKRLARAAALSSGADEAADRLELADLKLQRGDFRAAQEIYVRLSAEQERAAAAAARGEKAEADGLVRFRALEGLCWCAFELGQADRCRELGARALALPEAANHGASLRELLCTIELEAERWSEAERLARDFLAMHATHGHAPRIRFDLGLALARGGKTDEARRVLRALTRDDAAADLRLDRVWYELAWLERKAGREREALQAFAQVAEQSKDPGLAGEARLHLAEAASARGDHDEAARQLAAVEGKHRSRALHQLGFARYEKRQYADALRAFTALAELEPADAFVVVAPFLAAECHYELAQWAAAAALYRDFLRSNGDHERAQRARLHLGRAALEDGRAGEAAQVLRAWLARAPVIDEAKGSEPKAAKDGGVVATPAAAGGQAMTAAAGVGRADQARARLWLGRAELAQRRWARAEKALVEATRLAEGSLAAESWFRLGEARRGKGDGDGAIDAFVRLTILWDDPTWCPRALHEAALLFDSTDRPDSARKLREDLCKRYPESDEAGQARRTLREDKR